MSVELKVKVYLWNQGNVAFEPNEVFSDKLIGRCSIWNLSSRKTVVTGDSKTIVDKTILEPGSLCVSEKCSTVTRKVYFEVNLPSFYTSKLYSVW